VFLEAEPEPFEGTLIERGGCHTQEPDPHTFPGRCPSAASGAAKRSRARTTVSPISRMGTSVGEVAGESSRRLGGPPPA
jgi:hypothetical protein